MCNSHAKMGFNDLFNQNLSNAVFTAVENIHHSDQ